MELTAVKACLLSHKKTEFVQTYRYVTMKFVADGLFSCLFNGMLWFLL